MQEHFWGLRRKELQKINHYLNKNIAGYLEENNYGKIKNPLPPGKDPIAVK
jgi:hypothetical protein